MLPRESAASHLHAADPSRKRAHAHAVLLPQQLDVTGCAECSSLSLAHERNAYRPVAGEAFRTSGSWYCWTWKMAREARTTMSAFDSLRAWPLRHQRGAGIPASPPRFHDRAAPPSGNRRPP
jgi:hypothetical protein